MVLKKYSLEGLIKAVSSSRSIRQVLNKLNIKPSGGNYKTIHKLFVENNIDTSHFTGKGYNKGNHSPRKDIEDYLSNKRQISSYKLKNRLLKENYFKRICSSCNLEKWLDNPIPLELDHINGNSFDNSLSNLRLLCPNCHALTSNYRGKNKGNYNK
jgi:hypothetical protein